MCWFPVLYHCISWRDRFATCEGAAFRQFGWMCYPFHLQKHCDVPQYPHVLVSCSLSLHFLA